jgi:2-amino-4-hydroxy-6-hydroxymethyldihydropteridine diphosphokinase
MPTPVIAYIALGANLGDRRANIERAIDLLRATAGIRVRKVSSLLENDAVGGPTNSPAFLNAAVEVDTTTSPRELLTRLLAIERELGRERREKWGPRPIDLDLLLFGGQVIDEPDLKVPHPLMHERRFVLAPLAEIAPQALHPTLGKAVRDLL